MKKIQNAGLDEIRNLGFRISRLLSPGFVVYLSGDLGTGKTTFSKFIINSLIPKTEVSSPSFSIMNVYRSPNLDIVHCDFYRIKNVHDIQELCIEDFLETSALVIEWPKAGIMLHPNIEIELEFGNQKDTRNVRFTFPSAEDQRQIEKILNMGKRESPT